MPLVRIDILEGRTDAQVQGLADAVQSVMQSVFAAPDGDRYQVLHEHPPGRMLVEDTGLGIARTDQIVLIQVTQQGRTDEQKEALYATLADRLERDVGLAPSDLVVTVSENTQADWSFGHGRAQFLTGELG